MRDEGELVRRAIVWLIASRVLIPRVCCVLCVFVVVVFFDVVELLESKFLSFCVVRQSSLLLR